MTLNYLQKIIQKLNHYFNLLMYLVGLDKFAHLSLHWEKFVATDGITLSDRQLIKSLLIMILISI